MAFLRHALPALAVAGSALAQCGTKGSTTTIQNAGDASALANCRTYSGSIAIQTSTTDDIDFGNLQEIAGSLTATGVANMTSLSGASLQSIGDDFTLDNVQILSTLNFPQLTRVGTIDWTGLPNLQGLSFTTGIQEADSLSIQNTGLGSLDGINLQVVDTFFVANNIYLNQISMQLGSVGTALQIAANGRDVDASFPNMEWAYNMTFRNCSSVTIPSLASVNGSLGFYSNYLQSVSAPNLTTIGGGLSFVSNEDLTNVSFPQLNTVSGGLQLANNTKLDEINGFASLKRVGGAVDINGEFSSVELPQLSDVRGAMNLQSTEQIDNVCTHFQGLKSDQTIKGPYTCAGERQNPGGQGTLPDGTSSGSGSSGSPNPANKAYISVYVPRGFAHQAFTEDCSKRKRRGTKRSHASLHSAEAGCCSTESRKPCRADYPYSMHLTFGVEVENPFAWEGFMHIALHNFFIQVADSKTKDARLCKFLLHFALRKVAENTLELRKACLVEAVASGIPDPHEAFKSLVEVMARNLQFEEASAAATEGLYKDNLVWMNWFHHLPNAQDCCSRSLLKSLRKGERNGTCRALFYKRKSEFVNLAVLNSSSVFEGTKVVFKSLLDKYTLCRRKHAFGLLALHHWYSEERNGPAARDF